MADIDNLKLKITSDGDKAVKDLESIANAFERIRKSGKLTTVNRNLDKLSNNIKTFNNSSSGLKSVSQALQNIKNSAKGLGNSAKNVKKLNNELAKYKKQKADKDGGLFSFGNISFAGALGGIVGISKEIGTQVTSMGDYLEDVHFFNLTLGKFAEEAGAYADRLHELMGINVGEWISGQSSFMSMAVGFGIGEENAYKMSTGLTELAYDLASVHDGTSDVTEALTKLRSAMAGEIEPLRAWGMSLTEANLKELALSKGITKNIEAMTEAEKAQLRYVAIVETANSQGVIGNFANELTQPIQVIRILKNQLAVLGREIGSVFLPIIAAIVPYITAFTKILTNAVRTLAALVGFKMPVWEDKSSGSGLRENVGAAADSLGTATKKAKELKKHLMGFDELNILPSPQEPSSGGVSGGASGGDLGLDIDSVWNEAILSKAKNQTDELINEFKELGNAIKSAFTDNFGTIKAVVSLIVGVGAGILAWKFIPTILSAFSGGIGTIKGVLETLAIHFLYFVDGVVNFFTIASTSFLPLVAIIMSVASVVYVLWTNFDLVVAVIKGFIEKIGIAEKFEEIKKALKPLLDAVANLDDLFTFLGTTILIILQPAIAIIMGVFNAFIGIIKPLITIVTGIINIFGALGNFLVGVFTGDLDLVGQAVKLLCKGISDVFFGAVDFVISLVEDFVTGIIDWFWNLWDVLVGHSIVPDLANEIMNIFSSMIGNVTKWIGDFVGKIINWFTNLYNGIATKVKAIKDSVVSKVKEIWNGIVSWFGSNVAPKFTTKYWVDKFSGLKEGFSQTVKNMLNTGIDKINEFIRWLNGKLKFSWGGLTIAGKKIYDGGSVQLVRLSEITQRFDGGGFIEDGLFTMNKGEIAGQFDNGKSVVANNYQITEGISKAVYEAITRANSFSSKDITLNATFEVDGDTLGKKVIKYHNGIVNQTGESPLTI